MSLPDVPKQTKTGDADCCSSIAGTAKLLGSTISMLFSAGEGIKVRIRRWEAPGQAQLQVSGLYGITTNKLLPDAVGSMYEDVYALLHATLNIKCVRRKG